MSLRLILPAAALAVAVAVAPAEDARPVPARAGLPPHGFIQGIPAEPVTFEMVYVPGGTYTMGSPESEPGRKPDEGPRRTVTVRPFWLGKFEVSWDEFDLWWKNPMLAEYPKDPPFPQNADALTRPTEPYVPEDYGHGREGFPAICMSHHAAMMYCEWLRQQTGRGYRLPTEAEWEFACRAGSDAAYSFGPDADTLGEYAQFKGNSADDDHPKGTTAKCGSKKPNKLGLYDMHGNAAEWCLDHYAPNFYATAGPKLFHKPTDQKWSHTVRGGSFKDTAEKCRSAARLGSETNWIKFDPQNPKSIWWLTKLDQVGFRLCLPADEYPELVGLKPMVVKKSIHDPVTDDDK